MGTYKKLLNEQKKLEKVNASYSGLVFVNKTMFKSQIFNVKLV
jgi:hypothetical protein